MGFGFKINTDMQMQNKYKLYSGKLKFLGMFLGTGI